MHFLLHHLQDLIIILHPGDNNEFIVLLALTLIYRQEGTSKRFMSVLLKFYLTNFAQAGRLPMQMLSSFQPELSSLSKSIFTHRPHMILTPLLWQAPLPPRALVSYGVTLSLDCSPSPLLRVSRACAEYRNFGLTSTAQSSAHLKCAISHYPGRTGDGRCLLSVFEGEPRERTSPVGESF